MNRRSSRKSHAEGKRRFPESPTRRKDPRGQQNTASGTLAEDDSRDEMESPRRAERTESSGMYPAVTFEEYGRDEGAETFDASRMEAYAVPAQWEEPDPFGDDLFADLPAGFRPDSSASYEISAMVRWGIPPRVHEFRGEIDGLQTGDTVLVETEKGQFFGEVASAARIAARGRAEFPRRILRLATPQDRETFEKHRKLSVEAFSFANTRIRQLNLDMKLFTVFVLASFDKMMFYFTSDARVDFRRLVRDLAARFSMRIEMRQMGPRDDSRITGGLGICGRELCCASHLNRFIPVSIRMAKDQNLVLNPQNISGQCGRLKCCLAYEQEFYQELRDGMPKIGKRIQVSDGMARVQDVNLITGQIRVLLEGGGVATYSREQYRAMQQDKAPEPEPEIPDEKDPDPEF